MIISILNPKGGSGKTTLATNLARGLQAAGLSVLLVDSDTQGTLRDWNERCTLNDSPLVVAMDKPTLEKDLPKVGNGYDVVIIDGSAKSDRMNISAIKASDCVIIPLQPSGADIWAVADLVEHIKERQEITDGKPKAAFMVSRAIRGTRFANEAAGVVREYGLHILEKGTTQKMAYIEALTDGSTVLDTEPKGKAALEIQSITNEVMKWLKLT
jgi:chromosome partitioning protein